MMKLITLLFSYIVVCLRLLSPGGVRAIATEDMVLRQQLITLSRNQKRAPKLTFFEKITASHPFSEDNQNRINPASSLHMNGTVDTHGNPFGSGSSISPEPFVDHHNHHNHFNYQGQPACLWRIVKLAKK